ncbi:PAP/fibrillin family protein [Geminocystis sp. NIES-3709]|uniref:PAP/fibrillin family protein n=1 Tax=Geminocystis sp. NIES-3709 TaxID=1617448 RepID=UPI0005FC6407|nr:PAP/fibrillin family protein [Geminocystis sp. NIES-3709]BAQ66424.1 fibrillin [Geminocystis sp. NIES-3709]
MNLKAELLQLIANKNRGLSVTETEKVDILTAIEKLEDHNPNQNPLNYPKLLNGDWRLLYTTSKSVLGLENIPLLHLGEIYQCVRIEATKIYNIAEIVGLPFLDGLVSVSANFETVSAKRVNVQFQRSIIGLQRLLGYLSPKDLIKKIETGKYFPPFDFDFNLSDRIFGRNNSQGWLEITYLDETLRIARGHQGSVFILERC